MYLLPRNCSLCEGKSHIFESKRLYCLILIVFPILELQVYILSYNKMLITCISVDHDYIRCYNLCESHDSVL